MGTLVCSLLWVMQGLCHQPKCLSRCDEGFTNYNGVKGSIRVSFIWRLGCRV